MLAERRKLIFDAAKARGATFTTRAHVAVMDMAIDAALAAIETPAPIIRDADPIVVGHRRISAKGRALIHSFEQCKLETYPDPGSKDGKPVTGGWGATLNESGQPFALGFTASQEYWDALFDYQIQKYEQAVDALTKDVPTDQSMFDAFCSLAYNIGIDAFRKSTVLRKHKAGDTAGAAAAFAMWVKNDGRVMRGLVRRRAAEASLYLADG